MLEALLISERNREKMLADLWAEDYNEGEFNLIDRTKLAFNRKAGTASIKEGLLTFNGDGYLEAPSWVNRATQGKDITIKIKFRIKSLPSGASDYRTLFETGAYRQPAQTGWLLCFNNSQFEFWSYGSTTGTSITLKDILVGTWQTLDISIKPNGTGSIVRTREDGTKNEVRFTLPAAGNSPKLTIGGSWVAGDKYYFNGDIERFSISRPWEEVDNSNIDEQLARVISTSVERLQGKDVAGSSNSNRWFKTTLGKAPTGTMTGTPWGGPVTTESITDRVIQHCLPSLDKFMEIAEAGGTVYYYGDYNGGLQGFTGLDRNGFKSSSAAKVYGYYWFMQAVYEDPVTKEWMFVNTNRKVEAIPYTPDIVLR